MDSKQGNNKCHRIHDFEQGNNKWYTKSSFPLKGKESMYWPKIYPPLYIVKDEDLKEKKKASIGCMADST